jgi:hypothetical protein
MRREKPPTWLGGHGRFLANDTAAALSAPWRSVPGRYTTHASRGKPENAVCWSSWRANVRGCGPVGLRPQRAYHRARSASGACLPSVPNSQGPTCRRQIRKALICRACWGRSAPISPISARYSDHPFIDGIYCRLPPPSNSRRSRPACRWPPRAALFASSEPACGFGSAARLAVSLLPIAMRPIRRMRSGTEAITLPATPP